MRIRRPTHPPKKQLKLIQTEFGGDVDVVVPRERMTAEDLFGAQCRAAHLPTVTPQHYFAKALGRRWRFDWAFLDYMLAVEIEGLCVARRCPRCYPKQLVVIGGHASITGIKEDMEKYNTAALLGYTVLRFQQKDVMPRHALNMTLRILAARGWVGSPSH